MCIERSVQKPKRSKHSRLEAQSQGPPFDRGPAFRSRELRLRLLEGEGTFLHRTAQWESVRDHSGCWVKVALTS